MYQGQVAEALAGAGEGSPTPQEINRLKAHRKQLAEQQAAMRTHRAEQERTHQDLEIRAARLAGRRTALNGAATQAGRASQQAQAKGAAKGGAAAMAGLALQGLFGSVANAQAWLPVPQAGLVAALGQDLPAPDWQDGWEGFADEIEWQLAWDCYWLLVSGWMTEVEAAQAWAEGAAWEELAETDPKTVRDRQTTLEAEAADFYLEADQHHNDYEEAMGEAWFTLDEQEWAEQSALLADSFVFDANFALNMIDAELSALDASLESAGPGVEVDLRATGEESGHIFDAVITNLGEEAITYIFERGLVLLSGSRDHSNVAVTEPVTVEVEPGESATVPVQGFPMDPDMETPDQWDADSSGEAPTYTPGEVSFEVVDVLDTTDQVLEEEGLEANSQNRTAVAQWAFWRQGGLPASRMTMAAFLGTVEFLGLLGGTGPLGGLLGDLLGGRGKNDEAKGLMAVVDEVVARTAGD
ncbi:hypothetical protein IIA16_04090 [bacterium]|nr:hypothetical protein [bacterium]